MQRRYCQRCSTSAQIGDGEYPKPCRQCGGTNFDLQPPLHRGVYRLSENDRIMLRTNGIDPEED